MKSVAIMMSGAAAWTGAPWEEVHREHCDGQSDVGACLKTKLELLSEDAKAAVDTFDACGDDAAKHNIELYRKESIRELRRKKGHLSETCQAALLQKKERMKAAMSEKRAANKEKREAKKAESLAKKEERRAKRAAEGAKTDEQKQKDRETRKAARAANGGKGKNGKGKRRMHKEEM